MLCRTMCYKPVSILFIVMLLVQYSHGLNFNLVRDYFDYKNTVVATLFACSSDDYFRLYTETMKTFRSVVSGATFLDQNVSFPHLMHSPYHKMGVYLDYTCEFGKAVLTQSSDSFLLNSSYAWLIKINTKDELTDFEYFNFGLDSDVILAVNSTNSENNAETIELIDLYKVNSTTTLITTPAGLYDEYGLHFTLNGSIIARRRDFKGVTFDGTIVIIDMNITNFTRDVLETFVEYTIDPQFDALSRCVYIYYTYLMKMFNFTLNLHSSPSFGYPNRKGPILHDGMIGQLENKEIDIGLTPATMQIKTRMDVVHYTLYPVWMFRCLFIFCHPRTLGTYKALIIPFSTTVWIFVIVLTFAVGAILTAIKYFSVSNPEDIDTSFSGNIVITIGALYQQGLPSCSYKIPERIVLFCTLILGVMIVTFYNSMIVTSLLQPPPKYIRTPRQLMDSSFHLALQNHSYVHHFFEKTTIPVVKEMFDNKVLVGPGFIHPMEGMNLVQSKKYAFFSEEPILYRIIEQTFTTEEICSLQEIELENPLKLQIPLRRNSPLMEFFNHGILLMKETGIIQIQSKKWHPRKPQCQGGLSIPSVELQSVLIAYMILLSGFACSLFILSAEVIYSKYNKNKFKKVGFILKRNRMENRVFY